MAMNMRRCLFLLSLLIMPFYSTSAQELREVVDELAPNAFNVVTYESPRVVKLKDLGLEDIGLTAGEVFPQSDEIRIFKSRDVMNYSPAARIWFNAKEGSSLWFHTGGSGYAGDYEVQPGEVIVIYTRMTGTKVAWENPLAEKK